MGSRISKITLGKPGGGRGERRGFRSMCMFQSSIYCYQIVGEGFSSIISRKYHYVSRITSVTSGTFGDLTERRQAASKLADVG
jgi:hypothetical protein